MDPGPQTPDPDQGHAREWPSTPYTDAVRAPEPPADRACCIALIGDCTVAGCLWPPAHRPENLLRIRLHRAFPTQPVRIRNLAQDGGSARQFLESGGLARLRTHLPRVDIAFVRYGINDRKTDGVDGCIRRLEQLCADMKADSPAVRIFIETNIWVDYPAHYLWDRNARLAPLYDRMRQFAAKAGYPVVDIFRQMEAAARAGNWDLRIRGLPGGGHDVLDDSLDEFFGADPAYFTNIHPNARGMGLIADWEVAALQAEFGATLPAPRPSIQA